MISHKNLGGVEKGEGKKIAARAPDKTYDLHSIYYILGNALSI